MDVDLARQYMQYKRDQGLPADQDNCLYFIHFLLEQEQPSNGVMWVSKEADQGVFHHAFQVIDKSAFARKYGILSDGKTIPKYDSIRRLLNNYAFHCDKKIIWYCSQLDDDGMRLFRPKKGYLLLKIKKKGYRTPSISYMYPGHDEEFWVPSYAAPYAGYPQTAIPQHAIAAAHMMRPALAQNPALSSPVTLASVRGARSPFDPPLLKKPKLGENALGDEDAAALLTDLGRGSPNTSPRQSPKMRLADDDASDNDDTKKNSSMEIDEAANSSSSGGGAHPAGDTAPTHFRPRRSGRTTHPLPESSASGLSQASIPSSVNHVNSRNGSSASVAGLYSPLGMPGAANAHNFFPHPQGAPFAWPPSEVYKLYAQHPAFSLMDKSAFNGGNVDPSFQQQHLQMLHAQQQLYNSHLAHGGNAAAQAYLQQQQLAQLALQQQLQAQVQAAQHQAQQQSQNSPSHPHQAAQGSAQSRLSNLSSNSALSGDSKNDLKDSTLEGQKSTSDAAAAHSVRSGTPGAKSEDSSLDADVESIDTEDGYATPDASASRQRKSEEPLTLSEANALSKRNKFFYKQLRDHLDYGSSNSPIGFVNDLFFLMDPKLHVGPTNRDGTFEKRVRLHFIEYVELKPRATGSSPLWLCWGTLLDAAKTPIFRRSSQFYRIPGNQSAVLKSHSRAPHDWDIADEESKTLLRNLATTIKTELDSSWESSDIASARSMVDGLKLVLPNSSPLDDKGDFLPMPNGSDVLYQGLLENCLNRSPVATPTTPPPPPSDPRSAALHIWRTCNLPIPDDIDADGWTEAPVTIDAAMEAKLAEVFGLSDHVDSLIKLFRLFAAPQGKFTFSELVLTIRRFGDVKSMFAKMLDLLSTGAFNGNLSSGLTYSFLNDQPDGTYLIRYSHTFPENFVLCSRVHGSINQLNKIFNQPTAGLEIELEGRLCQVTQWSSIIKSCPTLRSAAVAPQSSLYKDHGISLVELLADRRYQIPAEPFAALPASTRAMGDLDSSSDSGEVEQPRGTSHELKTSTTAKDSSVGSSASVARHELEAKLTQERSADILSYISKLRAQSRIGPSVFQEWCLFVSSAKSKDITSQLHSLLLAFREEPDLWIAFANEVIPRKVVV